MKRAKKSPKVFVTSGDVQIYRSRMQAYLDSTQENFRRIVAEAIQSEEESPLQNREMSSKQIGDGNRDCAHKI